MNSDEATLAVITALETLRVPYLLVGSLSSNFYGVSRATNDADFIVQLEGTSARHIAALLGPSFRLDPQMTFETATMTTRQVLDVADIPFRIEFFHLSDDPHDQERFRRRVRADLFGHQVFVPTAEDVIVTKLRWSMATGRTKDWDDTRGVIAVQGEKIDWQYVYGWCDRHGTRERLEEIRRSIPPL
jgi:hypothetical protein